MISRSGAFRSPKIPDRGAPVVFMLGISAVADTLAL